MNKSLSVSFLAAAVCVLLLSVVPTCGQTAPGAKAAKAAGVLPLVEKFKAPPYPKSLYLSGETYDYRLESRSPLPPTLTDTFICDVWQRITMDLKLTITPDEVTEGVVKRAFGVYLEKKWSNIAGYRPWTHWNFIRRLKKPQRKRLAGEVVAYIKKNGVKDVDEE